MQIKQILDLLVYQRFSFKEFGMPKRKRVDEESKESEQALVIIKKRHWNEHLDEDADMKFNNDRWTKEEDALLLVCFEGACSALGLTTKEEKETGCGPSRLRADKAYFKPS